MRYQAVVRCALVALVVRRMHAVISAYERTPMVTARSHDVITEAAISFTVG